MGSKFNHVGYIRILALIIPSVLIVGGIQTIGMAIAGLNITDYSSIDTSQKIAYVLLLSTIGSTLSIWLFTRYIDKIKFKEIGFFNKNVFSESFIGFSFGAIAIALGFFILITTGQIKVSGINFDSAELLLLIAICALVSFTEEILCRGYILRNLTISFNKYLALIISSVIFSFMHVFNAGIGIIPLISLFLAGVLIGMPYIFNQRLWFPFGIHFSWNFFQGIFGFKISGNNNYLLLDLDFKGKEYLTGGEFGFEGSVYSIIIQVLLIIGVFAYFKRSGK